MTQNREIEMRGVRIGNRNPGGLEMKKKTTGFPCYLFILLLFCLFGRELGSAEGPTGTGKGGGGAVYRERGFYLAPVFSYSPETGIAGGVMTFLRFPFQDELIGGNVYRFRTTLLYTSNGQAVADLWAGLPLGRAGYRLVGSLGYRKYPFDFYGIGNSTQKERAERVVNTSGYWTLSAGKTVGRGISLWLRYRFSSNAIDFQEGGPTAEHTGGAPLAGESGGMLSGPGVSFVWDRRDSTHSPRSGHAFQCISALYSGVLGSDYDYSRLTFDLRKYVPLFGTHALAFQAYGSFSGGNPPFFELPGLGGQQLLRGYYEGRYRDRQLLALQAEYRMPLLRRFGVAAFTGVGDVAESLPGFELHELKYSYGFGLRFFLDRGTRIPMRLDFGFGKDSKGVYLTMFEAY